MIEKGKESANYNFVSSLSSSSSSSFFSTSSLLILQPRSSCFTHGKRYIAEGEKPEVAICQAISWCKRG
nr:hypothetical protein Iba_chr05dCG4820 [Ipomoea batatas]